MKGGTEGDSLSILLYRLLMIPLALIFQREELNIVWAWYVDNAALSGPPAVVASEMLLLLYYGPACGYFLCSTKSILIDATLENSLGGKLLLEFSFKAPERSRYLGGFLAKAP